MKPFYLNEHLQICFPKRSVYNTANHDIWFRDEGIPMLGTIRGYFHEDHISVYVDDYNIPPIHPAAIMEWFNTYNRSLKYVELGYNRIENKFVPKLTIFRGDSVKLDESNKKEEKKEDLIEKSSKITKKNKIGFKKDENNSNK